MLDVFPLLVNPLLNLLHWLFQSFQGDPPAVPTLAALDFFLEEQRGGAILLNVPSSTSTLADVSCFSLGLTILTQIRVIVVLSRAQTHLTTLSFPTSDDCMKFLLDLKCSLHSMCRVRDVPAMSDFVAFGTQALLSSYSGLYKVFRYSGIQVRALHSIIF